MCIMNVQKANETFIHTCSITWFPHAPNATCAGSRTWRVCRRRTVTCSVAVCCRARCAWSPSPSRHGKSRYTHLEYFEIVFICWTWNFMNFVFGKSLWIVGSLCANVENLFTLQGLISCSLYYHDKQIILLKQLSSRCSKNKKWKKY